MKEGSLLLVRELFSPDGHFLGRSITHSSTRKGGEGNAMGKENDVDLFVRKAQRLRLKHNLCVFRPGRVVLHRNSVPKDLERLKHPRGVPAVLFGVDEWIPALRL